MKPPSLPSPTCPISRRDFLRASTATALGAPLAFSSILRAAAPAGTPGHAALRAGDLTAVIGDNSADGAHRAGYNGVWSLRHSAAKRSVFVPAVAGLNLEHIVTGEKLEDTNIFFEPRRASMRCRQISESEAELHQPPTPTFQVESWTRFRLVAPHYLDMDFHCVAHQPVFPRGYLALFWASYINAPADKSMYFLGGGDGQKNLWTQFCTQWHNDQSTVRHRDDTFEMTFPPGGRDALFKSLSRFRFDQPFFYGHFDDLMWLVMFDRTEGIRLTHSPSGGGVNAELQTTNPAWDFQFLVPKPEVGKEYGFRVRSVLRPRCSREEVLAEFRKWQETK
ncbi:MAG: twin-arginine translocation signal domain-containing protein [Verrucomicrobia bacterium]|nr:twin-arginine translocation signal domain-containing protein [Verrucomicrobiota bacterium]